MSDASIAIVKQMLVKGLNAYDGAETIYQKFTEVIPDLKKSKFDLGWMNNAPAVRAWVGDKKHFTPTTGVFSLECGWKESTLDLDLDDLEEGEILDFERIIMGMGIEAKMAPDDAAITLLLAAHGLDCMDGQYFYDTDHPNGVGGTYANTHAGSGTTDIERVRAYQYAEAAMRKFAFGKIDSDSKRVFNQKPDTLLCAVEYEDAWELLFNPSNPYVWSGTARYSNPLAGKKVEVIGDARVAAGSGTFLFATKFPLAKALVHGIRHPFNFTTLGFSEQSEARFERRVVSVSTEGRDVVGLGAPYCSYKITGCG